MFGKKEIAGLKSRVQLLELQVQRERKEFQESINVLRTQLARLSRGERVSETSIREGLPFEEITAKELQAKLQSEPDTCVLDVRTPHEWKAGHIAKAIHIEVNTLPSHLKTLSDKQDKSIYVICAAGGRSAAAAALLAEKGFSKIFNVTGGMSQYRGETVAEG